MMRDARKDSAICDYHLLAHSAQNARQSNRERGLADASGQRENRKSQACADPGLRF